MHLYHRHDDRGQDRGEHTTTAALPWPSPPSGSRLAAALLRTVGVVCCTAAAVCLLGPPPAHGLAAPVSAAIAPQVAPRSRGQPDQKISRTFASVQKPSDRRMRSRSIPSLQLLQFVPPVSTSPSRRAVVSRAVDPQIVQQRANEVLESDKILIAPAIQTANLAFLGPEIEKAMSGGADVIHCDIMDGHFTEKLTFGPMFVKSLRKNGITAPIDVHIMAVDIVDHLIEEFADAGANYITFHPEGTMHLDRSLSLIKSKGLKAGVVINPGTPIYILENIMDKVDIILLMSVNPGFKSQGFQDITYTKAQRINKLIKESGRKIRLEVDGRVGAKNIEKLAAAGIDMFVVGGSIFNSDDYGRAITELRDLAQRAVATASI